MITIRERRAQIMWCRNSQTSLIWGAVGASARHGTHSRFGAFLLVALSLSLIGCADLPRRPEPPVGTEEAMLPGFREPVRYEADSQASFRMRSERVTVQLHENNGERPLNMLALSGG